MKLYLIFLSFCTGLALAILISPYAIFKNSTERKLLGERLAKVARAILDLEIKPPSNQDESELECDGHNFYCGVEKGPKDPNK